jgi:RES domain-containing protein
LIRTAWRLIKTKYLSQAFDGEGSRLYGGRWSSPGRRVVYVSESLALAVLEVLVHVQDAAILPAYSTLRVTFDDALVSSVDRSSLPKHWRRSPPPPEAQAVGDAWIDAASSAILEVPSAVVEREHNYLINPAHRDFNLVTTGPAVPYEFDRRLLKQLGTESEE